MTVPSKPSKSPADVASDSLTPAKARSGERRHHETEEKDRVGFINKAAFGSGAVAEQVMNNGVNVLSSPIYNIGLGVSPALVGVAQSLPRLWDAISDPIIGHLSDNTRSRWGRRKPYMLVGAIFSALFFVSIWWVPRDWGQWAMFSYLLVTSIFFYTASTLFGIPWNAVGLALTSDYHEKTRVMSFRAFFAPIGGFFLPWLFALTELDYFDDRVQGARYISLAVGGAIIFFCMFPILFCKERVEVEVRASKQAKVPLLRSLASSLRNGPFLILTLMTFCILSGLFMVHNLGLYVMIYHIYAGDTQAASVMQGWSGTAYKVAALASIPLVTILAVRMGKRAGLMICLILAIVGTSSKWWLYTPVQPWLAVIPALFMGPGLTCVFMLNSSLLADVCDLDEYRTGQRREAMFSAVFGWFTKLGLTGAFFVSGFILAGTGFDESLEASQPEGTVTSMRLLFAFIPPTLLTLAFILAARFPITEASAYEVKQQLEQRRLDEESK